MITDILKNWPKTAAEAIKVQNTLRGKVSLHNSFSSIRTIAGIDCSYDTKSNFSYAFIVLMDIDELKLIHSVYAVLPTEFPYISGFLSFREAPVILHAFDKLPYKPDLLMIDGQGIAHPRRLGIASHIGVLLDIPSIGVAKSRLVGKYAEPENRKGAYTELTDKNEQIGIVLRSKERCKPLFISPGHKIDAQTALDITMRCFKGYRLPEPTRIADKISKNKPKIENSTLL